MSDEIASPSATASTLAQLQPGLAWEMRWRDQRDALRLQGSHVLNRRRPTRLPDASRKYVHGDPVKMIDWKAFARTDQLLLREQRDEAAAVVRIALDASTTMRWPAVGLEAEVQPLPPQKIEVALRIASHLAHSHMKVGDRVELWLVPGSGLPAQVVKPRLPADVISYYQMILRADFDDATLSRIFHALPFPAKSCDLSYWVSDGLSAADMAGFLAKGKKSAFIHVLSSLEVDTSWLKNKACYFDEGFVPKGPALKEFQGDALLSDQGYLKSLHRWFDKLRHEVSANGAYIQVTETTTIEHYFKQLSCIR